MKRAALPVAFITLALAGTSVIGQQSTDDTKSTHAALYPPADIQWKDGPPSLPPGAKFAVLEGDPSKDGMFVMRIRVPDGFHIPAHTHPKPERVTVIAGTFKLAMGENPKKENAQVLPAGTYGVWPAGMVHAAWMEGETTVQVHGIGPWAINYVNPDDDPRKVKKAQ